MIDTHTNLILACGSPFHWPAGLAGAIVEAEEEEQDEGTRRDAASDASSSRNTGPDCFRFPSGHGEDDGKAEVGQKERVEDN